MRRIRLTSLIVTGSLLLGGGIAAAQSSLPSSGSNTAATRSYLTDDAGRSLILRGFNTASSAKSAPDGMPDFTEADLVREHAEMGTNFVRFLISWRSVEPEPGKYDQAYLDRVEERVDWYAERGYKVMLDMHQDVYSGAIMADDTAGTGAGPIGNGAPAWATYTDGLPVEKQDRWELYYIQPGVMRAFDNFWNTTGKHPELMEHYVNAWRAVAERFADNDTVVAYDLMNEPWGGSLQFEEFEAGPLTDLYQRSTNAIRSVDQDSWVCVAPQAVGVNQGIPSRLGKVTDPRAGEQRIAYCPHLYPLPLDLGDGYSGVSKTLTDVTMRTWRASIEQVANDVLGGAPIIIGEFGLDTTLPGARDFLDRVYTEAREMGAGVSYWSSDPGTWGPYMPDGTPTILVETLNKAYPRAVAGTPVSWSSSVDRLELTYRNDPAVSAPTEIYLPAAGFPGDVAVQGADVVEWDKQSRILTVRSSSGADEVSVTVTPAA